MVAKIILLNMVLLCFSKIDKKIKIGALCKQAEISGTTLAKMGRGENVTVDVLVRIYRVLECSVNDIMDIEKDE